MVRKHNDLFSNKIKTSAVTNQLASGRCWLFAGLNVLRPDLVVKHKLGKFELSQSYLAFWDKMEKANCFLEDSIDLADRDTLDRDVQVVLTRACVDDGWWEYVAALIKKYGVVPQEIMPETRSSSNTAQMN
ncbi:MAG: C1 family peptidase, partial [Thermoguttaceae bacterium]